MARVTVEDCILNVPNRFELVVLAAQRAKAIASGTPLTIDRDNDKDAVVSLREIAEKTISLDEAKENLIVSFCKRQLVERIERPANKNSDEVQQMLAEEGAASTDDVEEHLSVGITGKSGISFEGDNVDVED